MHGSRIPAFGYKVNKTSRDEYTRSRYTEYIYRQNTEAFADKMRAAANADDVITATVDWTAGGGLKHDRNDNFVDFTRGNVLLQSGANQYRASTIVGITNNVVYVLYDIVDIRPTNFDIKTEPPTAVSGQTTINAI